jgi:hypothetical protein
MNEQACAFVCAIFSAISMILSGFAAKTGDGNLVILSFVSALVVMVISGFVLVCKYC